MPQSAIAQTPERGLLARLGRAWPFRRGPDAAEMKASATAALLAFERLGDPVWAPRDYAAFAREGFMQNAVVYRAVRLISEAAASVPLLLYEGETELTDHPLLDLLRRPSPVTSAPDLLESWYGYLLVSGNAYLEAVAVGGRIRELHALRPDRVKVIPGADGWPEAYEYTVSGQSVRIAGEVAPGVRPILHVKLFHPANDHYGLSPIEAAATAIDIHNAASRWNKALLDNSARPSGALVYASKEGSLTAEQHDRLKRELELVFQGSANAGRPLLLEGGLDWRSMSLSPKDMDFIEAKNVAAREIALALGIPPMLLGIPGDNTYSNYKEAQRAFWRQSVLPLVWRTVKALGTWLATAYDGNLTLRPDLDAIEALAEEREALWARLEAATFLTANEKREAVGYAALDEAAASGLGLKYSPDQPRDDQGRWTNSGGGERVAQVTHRPPPRPRPPGPGHNRPPAPASPRPSSQQPPTPPIDPSIANQLYRQIHRMPDRDSPLNSDTVAFATVDGKDFFGVNSQAPGYTQQDRAAADQMRATLIEKYPETMKTENIGWKPNDALYHAEATALMRAAREIGPLSGRTIEVHVDRLMFPSCRDVLPLLSRELGGPTIIFRNPYGSRRVLENNNWIR